MYNHAPKNYICPICLGISGIENEQTMLKKEDLVYKDELVSAFINSFFIKNNPGHAIVVPNKHFENIYDLDAPSSAHILKVAQKIAVAMKKAYPCDGVMLLQNNEPASGQHAFHFHLHIFPRYEQDELHLHMHEKQVAYPATRAGFANKLKTHLE